MLSMCIGQVTHALLTRPPLVLLRIEHSSLRILNTEQTLARLACVRHAASVHPEPGSNSHKKFVTALRLLLSLKYLAWFVCGLNLVSLSYMV